MISILTIGKGHRVWWSIFIGQLAFAFGRHDALLEWRSDQGDRASSRGELIEVRTRVIGWCCFVWWTRVRSETT
jgi:hypothetical protein